MTTAGLATACFPAAFAVHVETGEGAGGGVHQRRCCKRRLTVHLTGLLQPEGEQRAECRCQQVRERRSPDPAGPSCCHRALLHHDEGMRLAEGDYCGAVVSKSWNTRKSSRKLELDSCSFAEMSASAARSIGCRACQQ